MAQVLSYAAFGLKGSSVGIALSIRWNSNSVSEQKPRKRGWGGKARMEGHRYRSWRLYSSGASTVLRQQFLTKELIDYNGFFPFTTQDYGQNDAVVYPREPAQHDSRSYHFKIMQHRRPRYKNPCLQPFQPKPPIGTAQETLERHSSGGTKRMQYPHSLDTAY